MSEYTPTTDEVRLKYGSASLGQSAVVEFDRWLASTVRAAKAEAWDEAVSSAYLHDDEFWTRIKHGPNPYREADDE